MNPILVIAIGLSVVFIGLLCLIGIIYLMSFLYGVFSGERKRARTEIQRADLSEVIAVQHDAAPAKMSREQRRQLVAAASAAIAEYMGTEPNALRIHSIRRVGVEAEQIASNDRRELMAAISAAIAMQLDTDVSGIRIHSVRRIG